MPDFQSINFADVFRGDDCRGALLYSGFSAEREVVDRFVQV